MTLADIRKRPGMYIGDTSDGSGLQNMVCEVLANAIRESLRAGADDIDLHINADGSCTVRDKGWGLPVESSEGPSIAEIMLTQLASPEIIEHEKIWGGHQGVGLAVVNALSEQLTLHVWRDGHSYLAEFNRGVVKAPLSRTGKTTKEGTEITFRPDREIFGETPIDLRAVMQWSAALDLPAVAMRIMFHDDRPR